MVLGENKPNSELPRTEVGESTGAVQGFGVPGSVDDFDSASSFEWIKPERPCTLIGQYVGWSTGYRDGDFQARFTAEDPDGRGGPRGGHYSDSIDFNFNPQNKLFLYSQICRALGVQDAVRDFVKTNGTYPKFEDIGITTGAKVALVFTEFTAKSGTTGVGLNSVTSADTLSI